LVDCLNGVSSEVDGSSTHGSDGGIEGGAEGEDGESLEHGLVRLVDVFSIEAGEGGRRPPVDSSEIVQHLVQFVGVDLSVHPTGTVWGHLPPQHLKVGNESVVAGELLSEVVGPLIVLNPQGDVPGLPVCPSVVGRHV